ncbi:MAG: NUDIX hydrolase [Anaerolineae bacterium]|jgi:ADP-ribose pyrophosphatase
MTHPEDKVRAQAHGWQRLATDYPYAFRMFRVRQDQARWPDGQVRTFSYIQTSGAVWVVPVTGDGQIVLIRQFRYMLDDWQWEVPAGGFHDFSGDPIELAKHELEEEVGGSSDDWLYVGCFNTGASIIEEKSHFVLARGVRLDREPHREPAEIIEVHLTPIERAMEMARSGEIADAHSALALLCCEPYIKAGK